MVVYESRLKHLIPVLPGDTMIVETHLITSKDPQYTFRVQVTVEHEVAAKGQITLQWADSMLRPDKVSA
jgi:acyl-CoA thioesterase FadM